MKRKLAKINQIQEVPENFKHELQTALLQAAQETVLFIQAYKASIDNALGLNDGFAINDTEGDDYLTGILNNNGINGFEDDDIIIGKKGKDALDGGVGDDLSRWGQRG